MQQIAICGNIEVSGAPFEDVIAGCAKDCGIELAPVFATNSPLDAAERVLRPGQQPLVDLLIVENDLPGISGTQLIREVHDVDHVIGTMLVADSPEYAHEAITLGIDSYLVKPLTIETFEKGLCAAFDNVAARRAHSVELKFRDRARRIDFADILYAETDDHDQLVYLTSGSSLPIRCSSKALFSSLSHDPRFFKAGSSFIVNLSHVRSVSPDGAVRLSNDKVIAVPVRLRKSLEDALIARGTKRPPVS